MTDVNIALKLALDAVDDLYDVALLITGDSDIVPSVAEVKRRFKQKKQVVIGRPLMRRSSDLEKTADSVVVITPAMVKKHLFKVDPFTR